MVPARDGNPLLVGCLEGDELPPFAHIGPHHYRDAFEAILSNTRAEVAEIAGCQAAPTFENTVGALQRSMAELTQFFSFFTSTVRANGDSDIQCIEREIAPAYSRFRAETFTDKALFSRICELLDRRHDLRARPQDLRVLELTHRTFRRFGAHLSDEDSTRLVGIAETLASLGTRFAQNLMTAENDSVIPLASGAPLESLPDPVRAAARKEAGRRRLAQPYAITMSPTLVDSVLRYSPSRQLRQQVYTARSQRGRSPGSTDNAPIVSGILKLRQEQANVLGFPSFAHFVLDSTMARAPSAVDDFLRRLLEAAKSKADQERAALLSELDGAGEDRAALAPWDIPYLLEKARQRRYAINDREVSQYLPLESVIDAAFYVAGKLFGLTFVLLADAVAYHPDVRVWEVYRSDKRIGVFLGDYYSRPSKRAGEWTDAYRDRPSSTPVVANVLNVIKPRDGEKALLRWQEAKTVFHELGHALHALLSDVPYPILSWIHVPPDFVEFPSQLLECWLERPEILQRFARHAETGEPIPPSLIQSIADSREFGMGYATLEYASSAMLDLALHSAAGGEDVPVDVFEKAFKERIGLPADVGLRHRAANFSHIFSGTGYYASAYYSYLWAEMLAADGFSAFQEAGAIFDPTVSHQLCSFVFSAGAVREPADAFVQFRGRLPKFESLLLHRGLAR